jgi:hypothetical protein
MERVLVILVVLHTLAVGLALMAVPEWALRFGGWERVSPLFFPCQAGVFHLVLALGYLLEYCRHGSVTFLVGAKTIAFVFLITAALIGGVPWIVPFSGVTDGLMGLVVWLVHARVVRQDQT